MPEIPISTPCPAHPQLDRKIGEINAIIVRLEAGQGEMALLQAKMFTSIAVMEKTLSNFERTQAPNCGPRIEALEADTGVCKELRVGPRMETIENRQDKMLWGGVGAVLLATVATITKALWR